MQLSPYSCVLGTKPEEVERLFEGFGPKAEDE
jgi:hypothetical protein